MQVFLAVETFYVFRYSIFEILCPRFPSCLCYWF